MKKNLISIMILALLIVNIVLSSITLLSVSTTNKKTAALVGDVAAAINLDLGIPGEEEEEAEVVPMENVVTYDIPEMTLPMKRGEDGKDHYAMLSVTLSMNSKHDDFKAYSDLTTRESLIKGEINDVVGQYSMDQIGEDRHAVEVAIEDAILERIQTLFGSDFIFDVTLSSSLYQ